MWVIVVLVLIAFAVFIGAVLRGHRSGELWAERVVAFLEALEFWS